MARHRADAADAQAVIAAEQDRQPAEFEFGVNGGVHGAVPLHHLVEMAVAADWRRPRVDRADEVAAVDHFEAVAFEDGHDVGHAHRLRAHARAARAGADVGGRTDEGNEAVRHARIVGQ
jgi:hypothetical protein